MGHVQHVEFCVILGCYFCHQILPTTGLGKSCASQRRATTISTQSCLEKKKSDLNVHACSSLDALLSSVRPLLLAGLEVLEMMP